ncbi:MAG: ABC transporter ATP-binding protein [Velocimicrobium sp.]
MKYSAYKMNKKLKISIVGVIAEGLLSSCNFLVLFQVLDIIFKGNISYSDILRSTGILGIIIVTRIIMYATSYTGCQIGGSDVSRNVRILIGDKLKRIPLGLFTKNRTGFYINATTSEVADYEQVLTHKVADIAKYIILLIAVGVYACTLYVPIGAMLLLSLLAIIPTMYFTIRQIKIYGVKKNLAREENVSAITEYLTGSQTLRSYGMAGNKNKSLTQAMKNYSDISYGYEKVILPIGNLFGLIGYVVLSLSILLSVHAWIAGIITPSALVILIMLPLFTSKVNVTLYIALTSYRNLLISKEKINRIFDETEDTVSGKFSPVNYGIEFKNVSFAYEENEKVIIDMSFLIPEHSLTAIVGDSGSGKSTIFNLLSRYYCSQKGEIYIGKSSISKATPEQVLGEISLVDQEVFFFNDSVMNNIRYSRVNATDQEVIAACAMANCDQFIRKMDNGYDTVIGENGNRLSGGERQRLSLARAILKNSPIILLDEATASLDIENELLVKQAVTNLLTADKTVIMIAHTLSIVKNADQILVVNNGTITQSGIHEELIKKSGKYADMWKAEQCLL